MARQKILITGANGVIGKILTQHLMPDHDVVALRGRTDLDLMDANAVQSWFAGQSFNVIIHCAAAGADNVTSLAPSITHTNLVIWDNIKNICNGYGSKLINIASGCELGTGANRPEYVLRQQLPLYPYALSKNLIARDVLRWQNWYNLRLFGIIAQTRLFNRIDQAAAENKETFDLYNDRYMDYISEADFIRIVRHYVENFNLIKDINLVYLTKKKISQVAQAYIEDQGFNIKLNVLNTLTDADYTGCGLNLSRMGIL
jgi:dTDP-4-dehydrorhamnose reductase